MENNSTFMIAGSIVVAGVIIAGAILVSDGNIERVGQQANVVQNNEENFGNNNSPVADNILPINSEDRIFGNKDAPISIVEFSDIQCPFCARFHPVLLQIVEEYKDDVKWVYRHFPLTSIHENAESAAIASECVGELGGNEAFWEFIDTAFKNQGRLGIELYSEIAGSLGIDTNKFLSCIESGRYNQKVTEDLQDAIDSGGRGTPYVVVIAKDGQTFPFSGALPYESVKQIIEQAINR